MVLYYCDISRCTELTNLSWEGNIIDLKTKTANFLFPVLFDGATHIKNYQISKCMVTVYEPRCEKTGLQGFRLGPTQTGLDNHRK